MADATAPSNRLGSGQGLARGAFFRGISENPYGRTLPQETQQLLEVSPFRQSLQ